MDLKSTMNQKDANEKKHMHQMVIPE